MTMAARKSNHHPLHHHPRPPRHIINCVATLVLISLAFCLLLYKLDDTASRTKTISGHNLNPTPWHLFPPKSFPGESRRAMAVKILRCSPYLSCPAAAATTPRRSRSNEPLQPKCPDFFRWIHRDLEPWSRAGINAAAVERAREYAAFRVVIFGGRLFVEMYYDCVQSRLAFTVWGLVQLLKKYPGMVPDVDMMFDCMDKPRINRTDEHRRGGGLVPPPPLFRYCTTADHFDIPFPDWSFWGWPETNIKPWDEEFRDIKLGSAKKSWKKKRARAYWKGNPDVGSPVRTELLKCNHSRIWGAQIFQQDWAKEASGGYEKSKLSNQCNTRYKIYAEGYAWSVSLKYILSCGSLALIISPVYEDFFSRGLVPMKNYWPISSTNICPSIKYAVDWGIAHPYEAEKIGKAGQELMENLSMNRVYDYMFHLISEYSKLQRFKPVPPSSSQEVCSESLLCFADSARRRLYEKSTAHPSPDPPCSLQLLNGDIINNEIRRRRTVIDDLEKMKLHIHTPNSKHF